MSGYKFDCVSWPIIIPGSTLPNITYDPGSGSIYWDIAVFVPFPLQYIQLNLELPEEESKDSAGCKCKKCDVFCEFAEPNQPDKTFICYACRNGL